MRLFAVLICLLLASCGENPAHTEQETKLDGSWRLHGRTHDEQRFSPLTQINQDTVSDLGLAWYADLDTRRGQEATPIIVDGVMFTTSAWSKVQAFDVVSGEMLWQFDPEVPGVWAVKGCCDVVNRGVAYDDGRLFVGTFDGRLIALSPTDGSVLWEVDTITDREKAYTVTGAPRVAAGKVIIGNGGGEFGVRGYITAYDVATGEQAWRFFTVPGNPADGFENDAMEMAAKTWNGEWWKVGGGGTVWDSMTYDPELDLLYVGVGNGSPWNIAERSPGGGDNLFISSIVALRPATGDYVWHYQTTPGDQWDYTATQQMILADLEIDGEMRPVLMQAPKNGFFYILDRRDGTLLSAEPFVQVTWATGVDLETGRPNIVPEALYHEGKGGAPYVGFPSPLGGHNWHPMAYSPDTGLVYIPAQDMNFPYVPDKDFQVSNLSPNFGVDMHAIALPPQQDIRDSIRKAATGQLKAWDPVAQKEVWRVEHGGIYNGGVLATAGGLVFQGNRKGDFAAYDDRTGEVLWSMDAQTGVVAPPVTFDVGGEQYVAVVAGWGGTMPLALGELSHLDSGPQVNRSRVLVYKLGGDAQLPPKEPLIRAASTAPEPFGTDDQVARGHVVYERYCGNCHGPTAVSGGVLPDLRYAAALSEEDLWFLITRDGALEDIGMVGFGAEVNDEDLNNIRAYIVHRAHESGVVDEEAR
ncbi:MAG: PQQ-dependent dehydrogenase, methanol/ethanol family [Pseudomonadota bacterium]